MPALQPGAPVTALGYKRLAPDSAPAASDAKRLRAPQLFPQLAAPLMPQSSPAPRSGGGRPAAAAQQQVPSTALPDDAQLSEHAGVDSPQPSPKLVSAAEQQRDGESPPPPPPQPAPTPKRPLACDMPPPPPRPYLPPRPPPSQHQSSLSNVHRGQQALPPAGPVSFMCPLPKPGAAQVSWKHVLEDLRQSSPHSRADSGGSSGTVEAAASPRQPSGGTVVLQEVRAPVALPQPQMGNATLPRWGCKRPRQCQQAPPPVATPTPAPALPPVDRLPAAAPAPARPPAPHQRPVTLIGPLPGAFAGRPPLRHATPARPTVPAPPAGGAPLPLPHMSAALKVAALTPLQRQQLEQRWRHVESACLQREQQREQQRRYSHHSVLAAMAAEVKELEAMQQLMVLVPLLTQATPAPRAPPPLPPRMLAWPQPQPQPWPAAVSRGLPPRPCPLQLPQPAQHAAAPSRQTSEGGSAALLSALQQLMELEPSQQQLLVGMLQQS